jgi:hypothetical protein
MILAEMGGDEQSVKPAEVSAFLDRGEGMWVEACGEPAGFTCLYHPLSPLPNFKTAKPF